MLIPIFFIKKKMKERKKVQQPKDPIASKNEEENDGKEK